MKITNYLLIPIFLGVTIVLGHSHCTSNHGQDCADLRAGALPADSTAADSTATGSPPVDEPSKDDPPADDASEDDPPADDPPADDASEDDPPADDASEDDPPADDASEDEPPADDPLALLAGIHIAIADRDNDRIQVYQANGVFLRSFGGTSSGDAGLSRPIDVAYLSNGNLAVTDFYNSRVGFFDSNGGYLSELHSDGPTRIYGLGNGKFAYVEPDAEFLYIRDAAGSVDLRYSYDSVHAWGDVAMLSNGKLVVAGSSPDKIGVYSVQAQTASSRPYQLVLEYEFGSTGSAASEFQNPRGITVLSDDTIVVADTDNHRISMYNADGTFLRSFGALGSGDEEFRNPQTVIALSNGNLAIADTGNHRIKIHRADGSFVGSFGSQGAGQDEFDTPIGITEISAP